MMRTIPESVRALVVMCVLAGSGCENASAKAVSAPEAEGADDLDKVLLVLGRKPLDVLELVLTSSARRVHAIALDLDKRFPKRGEACFDQANYITSRKEVSEVQAYVFNVPKKQKTVQKLREGILSLGRRAYRDPAYPGKLVEIQQEGVASVTAALADWDLNTAGMWMVSFFPTRTVAETIARRSRATSRPVPATRPKPDLPLAWMTIHGVPAPVGLDRARLAGILKESGLSVHGITALLLTTRLPGKDRLLLDEVSYLGAAPESAIDHASGFVQGRLGDEGRLTKLCEAFERLGTPTRRVSDADRYELDAVVVFPGTRQRGSLSVKWDKAELDRLEFQLGTEYPTTQPASTPATLPME